MSIFEYKYKSETFSIKDSPYHSACIYCKERLQVYEIKEDTWDITHEEIISIHEQTKIFYKVVHGLGDYDLNLRLDTKEIDISLYYCNTCGWWKILKNVAISAESSQIWDMLFTYSGALKHLHIEDINTPINEASKYLIAHYESRFSINPQLFEEVVASVFKEIGYRVHVTGYSNDGGIDVILGNSTEKLIGVQVKRYKNKIKVEQIRAFAGALMLSGLNRGIFVTTSKFQPGALEAARLYSTKTLPIYLMNADSFYDALKIAKRHYMDILDTKEMIIKENIANPFIYYWTIHRNSL